VLKADVLSDVVVSVFVHLNKIEFVLRFDTAADSDANVRYFTQ